MEDYQIIILNVLTVGIAGYICWKAGRNQARYEHVREILIQINNHILNADNNAIINKQIQGHLRGTNRFYISRCVKRYLKKIVRGKDLSTDAHINWSEKEILDFKKFKDKAEKFLLKRI